MPVDAFVHLDRLRCLAEKDASGHSEPYVWPVLLWVDDTTIGSGQIVGSSALGNVRGSRVVIKEGIQAGEQAAIPSVQRSLARRFEDGLTVRNIGLVVAMFEEDETPQDAVRAAYSAFVRELRAAVAEFIRTHLRGPETDEERAQIAAEVRPKVRAAGEGALSNFEKLQVFLGNLNLDDEIGFDTFFQDVAEIEDDESDTSFTLSFATSDGDNHYEIDGRLELRQPPPPDPCQDEVDRVSQARANVEGVQASIQALQEELRQAAPSQKAGFIAEIRRIRAQELPAAVAALEAAQQALALCRARQDPFGGRVVVADPLVADPLVAAPRS